MFGRCGPLNPDLDKEFAVPDYGNTLESASSEPLADPRSRASGEGCGAVGVGLIGIQDHPYQRRFYDTWTLIAYLAPGQRRCASFPDVANLPLRSPVMLAKAAASLDVLTEAG
jgi:alkanesulfonate monooxygenase SsuD/methylene tetrahydromethanopterin reductase-like flavin-dependent oxidoreductase (luciferase family)